MSIRSIRYLFDVLHVYDFGCLMFHMFMYFALSNKIGMILLFNRCTFQKAPSPILNLKRPIAWKKKWHDLAHALQPAVGAGLSRRGERRAAASLTWGIDVDGAQRP